MAGCRCPFARSTRSTYSGITIGAITYSFRSMERGPFKKLDYALRAGLGSVELMGDDAEMDAGRIMTAHPWKATDEERAKIAEWRKNATAETFSAVRKRYNDAGVKIHIVKFGDVSGNLSDAELDYRFAAARALGASAITREIPNPAKIAEEEKPMRRLGKFAEKWDVAVGFHNHTQIGLTTYDGPLLSWSPKFMINLDVGHYTAANDDSAVGMIEKYRDRICSIHLKDRTRKANGQKNLPFGEGDTPLKEIFALMKREGLDFNCDIELEYGIPGGSDAVKEVARAREWCKAAIG